MNIFDPFLFGQELNLQKLIELKELNEHYQRDIAKIVQSIAKSVVKILQKILI